jgi:hypothetical protein
MNLLTLGIERGTLRAICQVPRTLRCHLHELLPSVGIIRVQPALWPGSVQGSLKVA